MCECIDNIDESLGKQSNGTQWLEQISYNNFTVTTVSLNYGGEDKRGNWKTVGRITAKFCPFCGEKYPFEEKNDSG